MDYFSFIIYTDEEVADKLRISRRTLARWREKGKIPYILLVGKVIYPKSEIEKLLKVKSNKRV